MLMKAVSLFSTLMMQFEKRRKVKEKNRKKILARLFLVIV